MYKIGYIFDSTAIIKKELIEKYDISFVSLNISADEKEYKALEIDEDQFKKDFDSYSNIKSASPSPHDFEVAIMEKIEKGYEQIVIVTLSSKISTTYDVALLAINDIPSEYRDKVFVHDSLLGSIGMDPLVSSMDEVMAKDPDATVIIEEFEKRRPNSAVLFEINDLKHLFKGGRLSILKYFISVALKIKPLVAFRGGKLSVIGKNRNRNKTLDILFEHIDELKTKFKNVFVGLFSYDTEDSAYKKLYKTIKERWPAVKIINTTRICPVFMTHVGIEGYALSVVAFD